MVSSSELLFTLHPSDTKSEAGDSSQKGELEVCSFSGSEVSNTFTLLVCLVHQLEARLSLLNKGNSAVILLDEDSQDIQEVVEEKHTCPLCDKQFPAKTIEKHVNKCIEK